MDHDRHLDRLTTETAPTVRAAITCGEGREPDVGLTHIALPVRDVERSIDFYADFAGFEVVHQRGECGRRVVWLSDLRRPGHGHLGRRIRRRRETGLSVRPLVGTGAIR